MPFDAFRRHDDPGLARLPYPERLVPSIAAARPVRRVSWRRVGWRRLAGAALELAAAALVMALAALALAALAGL